MKIQWKNNWENPGAQDRLDLVFENRFTGYGAYVLRTQSSRNQVLAMAISFLGMAILVSLPRLLAKSSVPVLIKTQPKADSGIIYYPIFPLEPAPKRTNEAGGSKNNNNIPLFDPAAPMMSIAPANPFEFGLRNGLGDPNDIPNGSGEAPSNREDTSAFNLHVKPDHDCEYRGGLDAFSTFIRENFITPNGCSEGLDGYAMVKFCVNIDGHISNVEIVENSKSCPAFGEEVKRIVEMSPNWKPASRRGKLVKCFRQVPVRLTIE